MQLIVEGFFLALVSWTFILFAPAFSGEGDLGLILYRITWAFIIGTFILQIILSVLQVAMSKKSKWMRRMAPAIFFGYSIGLALTLLASTAPYNPSLLGYSIAIDFFVALIGNIYTVALIIMGCFIRWICGIVKGSRDRE